MSKIQALYSRVSTDIQRDRGHSIPRQKEWLEQEAARQGFNALEHFTDDGYSAAHTNRPAFQRLLNKIEAGGVETVVVYKCDRIARNVRDLLSFVDLVQKHGVRFISLSENLNTTAPTGRLILTVMGSLAEWERGITVERVKDAMYDKAKKGNFCGGQPPFGYDIKDKRLVVNNEEAALVRKMYDKFENLRSYRAIVSWLNNKGYKTKRGQSWPTATVKRILSHHLYKGYYTYGKRAGNSKVYLPEDRWLIIKGDFQPLISEEQFDRIQAIVRQKKFIRPVRTNVKYLLSGLLKCKECGGAVCGMTTVKPNGRTFGYYRCHEYNSKGSKICSGIVINQGKLEGRVLEEIQKTSDLHFADEEAERILEGESSQEEIKRIDESIIKLKRKQANLLNLYENDTIPKELLVNRMKEVTDELDGLQLEKQRIVTEGNCTERAKRLELIKSFSIKSLKQLPAKAQSHILRQLIKQIWVSKPGEVEIEMYEL